MNILPWLPAGALDDRRLQELVAAAVAAWSRAWIAGSPLVLTGWRLQLGGAAACRETGWRSFGAMAFRLSSAASERLLGLSLGLRLERASAADADLRLLEAFEAALMGDLAVRIAGAVDAPATGHPERDTQPLNGAAAVIATVRHGGTDELIQVAISAETLMRRRKALAPAPRPRSGRPVRRADAVLTVPLTLKAVAGRARAPLGSLTGLERGDVLVLEPRQAGDADLVAPASERVALSGRILVEDGRRALQCERGPKS